VVFIHQNLKGIGTGCHSGAFSDPTGPGGECPKREIPTIRR
jgi:hypothetical protein